MQSWGLEARLSQARQDPCGAGGQAVSSSVFCCLPKLAAPGGGFCPRALSARAAACWHAAYALHNSRGRHSRRTQEALEFAS